MKPNHITDSNNVYLSKEKIGVIKFYRGFAYFQGEYLIGFSTDELKIITKMMENKYEKRKS